MNVRPGDLAVIVNSYYPENNNAIVEVVRPYFGEVIPESGIRYIQPQEPVWVVRSLGRPLVNNQNSHRWHASRDSRLRPIRDSDGEDEMLRIAGLPQKETA